MSTYRRRDLGDGFGYSPGEQPGDAGGWLKLNTNESPLPASPAIAAAVHDAAAGLSRYPHPEAEPLRTALAEHHGVTPGQVFVANGGDQVLDCCFRAFVAPGDAVIRLSPSYSLLPALAQVFSARDVAVPYARGGTVPRVFAAQPARLRFVVNPNSPTGVWTDPGQLAQALGGASGIVAIDEAYCDFAPASCVPLLDAHPNWLVVRTLSKSHAVAGLRIGYAVGAAPVIEDLCAVKDSYPVDRCAIAGGVAALADAPHHRAIVDTVQTERARLTRGLHALGWDVPESHANFVFARPPATTTAVDVAGRLRAARILVRHFAHPALADRLRITIGDAVATDRLLRVVADAR